MPSKDTQEIQIDSVHGNRSSINTNQNRPIRREDMSFVRPQKPIRDEQMPKKPLTNIEDSKTEENYPVIQNVQSEESPKKDIDRTTVRPAIREANLGKNPDLGETRRNKLVSTGSFKTDDLLKKYNLDGNTQPAEKMNTTIPGKSKITISTSNADGKLPEKKKKIFVSAKNRNQEQMESIIKNEARITEIPGGKIIVPGLSRLARNSASKRYRLKGYCNTAYVDQKRKRRTRTFNVMNWVFWGFIGVLFLILFYWINPIDKIQRLLHLFGM